MESENFYQQTSHFSARGNAVTLTVVHHGDPWQCVEYIVEKEVVPFHQTYSFRLLVVSLLLFAVFVAGPNALGCFLTAVMSMFLIYRLLWEVKKESLLVIAPVGVQFTATFRSGQQTACFIPWHYIKDVLIIEAISMHLVLYNLVVLVENTHGKKKGSQSQKLIPLFQGTKPRLSCLECIYRSINCLMPDTK